MKKLIYAFALVMPGITISCSKPDYYHTENGEEYRAYYVERVQEMFKSNFEDTFGKIEATQHWDFSETSPRLFNTRANGINTTKVAGIDFGVTNSASSSGITSSISKNQTLYNSIKTTLPDGVKHTGKNAVLTAPGNSFTIYPLTAQGGFTHELWVKVGDEPEVQIYSKTWGDGSKPYCNGMGISSQEKKVTTYTINNKTYTADQIEESYKNTYYKQLKLKSSGNILGYLYIKENSYKNNIYNQPNYNTYNKDPKANWVGDKTTTTTTIYETVDMSGITITAPVGTPIQLYMKNVSGYSGKDFKIGTGSGNTILVDCPVRPEGLPESIMPANAQLKFIGFEDQVTNDGSNITGVGGDKDYNDMVVMIVGTPNVPEELRIESGSYETSILNKETRYMVEDLGSTDDFDYNDLVVDVYDYTVRKYETTITNGQLTNTKEVTTGGYPQHKQEAIIRAMGGTLDFELKIGNTTWRKSGHLKEGITTYQDMYNTGKGSNGVYNIGNIKWDASYDKFDVNGWDYNTNNVTFTVVPNGRKLSGTTASGTDLNNTSQPFSITYNFPEDGAVPFIIAVPTSTKWNLERKLFEPLKDYLKQYQDQQ